MKSVLVGIAALGILVAPAIARAADCPTAGPNLIVNGTICQLSGVYTFGVVQVINGGRIEVKPYIGGNKSLTGNLELRATSITVDATSTITARGTGYQTPLCGDGVQPLGNVAAGGCSVRDSGGGGSHFGGGGRGTKDCPAGGCSFPTHWEEDCGNTNTGASCSDLTNCRNNDGLPTTASSTWFHNIYDPEFGGSGGDKGCRDGDGYGLNVAGSGGGRIVLAGLDNGTGVISIAGTINTDGKRGCGFQNDSAGGGAGGTILIAGEQVTIAATARVTASGGLGGDTRGTFDTTGDCALAQQGSTCDDCGGGGGGGIISVLSVIANISDIAEFKVGGAVGGTCAICQGEAGGGAGELQLNGAYLGEFCDGFDNDFDSNVDEGLADLACASGAVDACVNGIPQSCPPDVPACIAPVTDTRARFLVIVDSSGSMLTDLNGLPTFGDGSLEHPGVDRSGNGSADDSKLFLAKRALSSVIAAYPDIDFSLARYHQDQNLDQACQLAHVFECAGICCSYDDPRNNSAPPANPSCTINGGAAGPLDVNKVSPGDECIDYAGNCGPPRRGADVLVGFGADINQYMMWIDGRETNFIDSEVIGDFCSFGAGGDCELRGTGPTPLANSLQAARDFLTPEIACDAASQGGCRTTGVILLTDGAESCNGDPITAAAQLRTALNVETFVVGFSVLATEAIQLDLIANAGSNSGTRPAILATDENTLANALASIVADSIVFETCNDLDDDCDVLVDEDFPLLGQPCDDGEVGACRGTGELICNGAGDGVTCQILDPGATPGTEVCNGDDDDCDGLIDEALNCQTPCTPSGPEVCDGIDNDCNGATDEDDPMLGDPCGATDEGICELGQFVCISGDLVCIGAVYPDPNGETCNNDDDDCDLDVDEDVTCPGDTACVEGACRVPCAAGEFPCPFGYDCVTDRQGRFCVPGPCVNCLPNESCEDDVCVDLCVGVTCDPGETCRLGECLDCNALGCPGDEVCLDSICVPDPCVDVDCAGAPGCTGEAGCSCVAGDCVPNCDDTTCPEGTTCAPNGQCTADACAEMMCPDAQVCVDGVCDTDPCVGTACPPGQACADGECVTDPCPAVTCSAGRHCEVDDEGAAECVSDIPPLPPDKVWAGGGGCAVGGGAGGGVLLALALAMLGRRRRR